jgi:hypothetical protein
MVWYQFETSQHRQILGNKLVTILNKNNKICILGGDINIICLEVKSLSAVQVYAVHYKLDNSCKAGWSQACGQNFQLMLNIVSKSLSFILL